jgi:plastocyanin
MNDLMMISLKSAAIVFLTSGLLVPVLLGTSSLAFTPSENELDVYLVVDRDSAHDANVDASAQLVPEWVKNTAKWFGDDLISEEEFLNAIKYLIDNDIIVLDSEKETEISESDTKESTMEYVSIPNANSLQSNRGSYVPFNLEIEVGTTVVWLNNDNFAHTVQSQDPEGNKVDFFSSSIIQSGDSFEHVFPHSGEYPYYCTFHPWRVGMITVR